jgi:hypothetical protein
MAELKLRFLKSSKYLFSKWKINSYKAKWLTHRNRMDNNKLSELALQYKSK